MNGGLRLACNADRWTEVKRQATTAHSFGLEMHLLTPKEAQDLWPLMTIDDLVGAAYLPTDGQANPSDITQCLARGARMAGVQIFEDTPVTRIIVEDGRIRGVETPFGTIECEKVVRLRRPVDPHPCRNRRRQRAPRLGRTPVHDHRDGSRA